MRRRHSSGRKIFLFTQWFFVSRTISSSSTWESLKKFWSLLKTLKNSSDPIKITCWSLHAHHLVQGQDSKRRFNKHLFFFFKFFPRRKKNSDRLILLRRVCLRGDQVERSQIKNASNFWHESQMKLRLETPVYYLNFKWWGFLSYPKTSSGVSALLL